MNEFEDSLKIMSYYHTSLRNIGVFTSTSFAGAIYSIILLNIFTYML
uniref:Uncharacterized protein n=1 Tax=viral metagenome TaxID=1070528 RepID=A0A6C0IMM0_9ZZZZ